MSFARAYSAQPSILGADIITVETDISKGLNAFSLIGLPDKAVDESRGRVSAAVKHAGFTSPKQSNQKTVIALAPADLKKEGPFFDLAMALSYLLADEEIKFETEKKLFVGELSLDGNLRPVKGILPIAKEAKEKGFQEIFVPKENAAEAALIDGISIFGAHTLKEVLDHLDEKDGPDDSEINSQIKKFITKQEKTKVKYREPEYAIDLSDIKGQENAKRGLEIAAAGGHNIALYGPPGTGKTLLAKAFASLLPPLTFEEILEVTSIHSVAGTVSGELVTHPPLRSPHHTASHIAITGGGSVPKPGEITLAHRGVLFMDEFPEFDRRVIETLRQPLEERTVSVSRARGSVLFPANFILIATLNPCPCGNFGSKKKICTCSPLLIQRYKRKISGPIMDRIDMWIEVPHMEYEDLQADKKEGSSVEAKEKILSARKKQKDRLKRLGFLGDLNGNLSAKNIDAVIPLSDEVKNFVRLSAERLSLSPRAYHKVLKLSRTIADMLGDDEVNIEHIKEALSYRPKEEIM
ncbi:MAG: YifB family Mg chelatase-like AAA ATPase [bacterium]|nr:YifB family Mg chelatase-like AAA ATPase [bacterium]